MKGTFVADTVAVNCNGIKKLLANGVSRIFINNNLVCGNGTRLLPRDTPDCAILDIQFFDDFVLADELIAKVYKSLKNFSISK